jgi:hypothetical protein
MLSPVCTHAGTTRTPTGGEYLLKVFYYLYKFYSIVLLYPSRSPPFIAYDLHFYGAFYPCLAELYGQTNSVFSTTFTFNLRCLLSEPCHRTFVPGWVYRRKPCRSLSTFRPRGLGWPLSDKCINRPMTWVCYTTAYRFVIEITCARGPTPITWRETQPITMGQKKRKKEERSSQLPANFRHFWCAVVHGGSPQPDSIKYSTSIEKKCSFKPYSSTYSTGTARQMCRSSAMSYS